MSPSSPPSGFHPEQGLEQFQTIQRRLHALAAQLRALWQNAPQRCAHPGLLDEDVLTRIKARRTCELPALQEAFGDGDSVRLASFRAARPRR